MSRERHDVTKVDLITGMCLGWGGSHCFNESLVGRSQMALFYSMFFLAYIAGRQTRHAFLLRDRLSLWFNLSLVLYSSSFHRIRACITYLELENNEPFVHIVQVKRCSSFS